MKKHLKRNIVIAAVLLFVCAAVYLNWSYNNKWGDADDVYAAAEDGALGASGAESGGTPAAAQAPESEYFAQARLTRQESRDDALELLEMAATADSASQEVIDSAVDEISVMAAWSMQETHMETLLMAKDFADCVVFMGADSVTVAVPAPAEGLDEAAVAQVTDTILAETGMTAEQLKIIEVRGE